MIIAIPVDIQDGEASVFSSFGRAPYYALYQVESKQLDFINNPAISTPGGAGIQAAQALVDACVSVLISPRIGENALQVIASAHIDVYTSISNSIHENIEAWRRQQLKQMTTPAANKHNL